MIVLIPEADREKAIYDEVYFISLESSKNISVKNIINTIIKKDEFKVTLNNKLYITINDK